MATAGDGQSRNITVVRAGVDDVARIVPLFCAYRQYYDLPPDEAASAAYLAQRLSRAESIVFEAEERVDPGRRALGFAQVYPSFSSLALRPLWILYDLFVVPEARRQGVGRALLAHVRACAAEAGASQVVLQTAVTNRPAQSLYESLGWRRDELYYTYELDI